MLQKIEKPEGWDDLPRAHRAYIMQLGARWWNQATHRLELRKRALELAVAAVGPQPPAELSAPTAAKIEEVAERLLAWLEKEKPKDENNV